MVNWEDRHKIPNGSKLSRVLSRFVPMKNEQGQIAGIAIGEEYSNGRDIYIMALNPLIPLSDVYYFTVNGVKRSLYRGFNGNHHNQINRGVDNHTINLRKIQENRRLQDLGKWNFKEHQDRRLIDLSERFDWSTVYIIGNSPKINDNYQEIYNVKKGVVIGLNRCMDLFEPDILMLADPVAKKEWAKKSEKTVGVFDTCTNYEIREQNPFKEYYWFNSFILPHNPTARWQHTWNIRQNLSVACEAFSLAIMMGAKNIIFAGCEHGSPLDKGVHWNDESKYDAEKIYTSIIDGKDYKSNETYIMTSLIISYYAYCLTSPKDSTYRVINATESGLMQMVGNEKNAMEIMTLKQAIEEMNLNISEKSPKYFLGNDI